MEEPILGFNGFLLFVFGVCITLGEKADKVWQGCSGHAAQSVSGRHQARVLYCSISVPLEART